MRTTARERRRDGKRERKKREAEQRRRRAVSLVFHTHTHTHTVSLTLSSLRIQEKSVTVFRLFSKEGKKEGRKGKPHLLLLSLLHSDLSMADYT
jgi:hypothetical protein